jgi:putative hemolysin
MTTGWEAVMSRKSLLLSVLFGSLLVASCGRAGDDPTQEAGLPNPASVYCEENGGTLELRTDASGAVTGICVFGDGSQCEEWAYFREECRPGAASDGEPPARATVEPAPLESSESAEDDWEIYRNEALGYAFHVPQGAIVSSDDPLSGVSISGTTEATEGWPQITINHPQSREDFRPPEDVDLAQWLADHNLLGDDRVDDVEIAGTTAIHLRHDRSPQSYAFDRYFFAVRGQLYEIVIGHVADVEDWEVYTHFLGSFWFE